MLTLQGTFFVCAMGGGRWPQVINVWDVGDRGWDGWAANVDRLNLKRRKAFYGEWWDEAAKWRTGGFDRLCGAVPGCPTSEELMDAGVRGTLFVHEALTVQPGSPLDFLAAVAEVRVPLMREYGVRFVIGKGGLGKDSSAAFKEMGGAYLAIIGGTAALETTWIEAIEDVDLDDLNPESLWKFRIKGFGPLLVAMDSHGGSLYDTVKATAEERRAKALAAMGVKA